jgi:hypothetical protein
MQITHPLNAGKSIDASHGSVSAHSHTKHEPRANQREITHEDGFAAAQITFSILKWRQKTAGSISSASSATEDGELFLDLGAGCWHTRNQ